MVLDRRWYIDLADRPCQPANSRVHLPGGSVTALAKKPVKMNHHLVPPGPRRTSPAGDANVESERWYAMRIGVLVCLSIALLLPARVQGTNETQPKPFRGGFQIGFNAARFEFPHPEYLPLPIDHYKSSNSFRAGLAGNVSFGRAAYLESSIFLSVKGMKVDDVGGMVGGIGGEQREIRYEHHRLYYLSLPITAGFILPTGTIRPRFFAGPEFSYLLAARSSTNLGSGDVKSFYPSSDFGLIAGVGGLAHLANQTISLDLAYTWGLTDLNNGGNSDVHHIYNHVLSLTMGIWL
jgi:hypothetical protein